ncbi:membrane protein [Bacillus phage Moonbeam]|uniref:Uncharacterized protein n=1 Tax=Bacillus phage Moonbeam TaxID=1540091 RepID=A0A0A0RSF4_9CAUD|nr:membrane protein [Bacillus phage Moonbeam]AIW03441.1 hypothetical protein CPT_Moonbeam43 [Bacillus phage Moonbeam]
MLISSICLTALFYLLACYLSAVTIAILYHAIRYKLPLTILKSSLFIGITYISIITDIVLFGGAMYSSVFVKNGLLTVLILVSIVPIHNGKESRIYHDDKRE